MTLFDDDEINKAMAEAEAMLTIKNRALFRKRFLKGYAEMRTIFNEKVIVRGFLSSLAHPHSLDLSNWSYLVGLLAGYFKWYPTLMCDSISHVSESINSIKSLYAGCDAIGKEEARKILRGLILAWQKRIKNILVLNPALNRHYLEFLSGLKGL